MGLFESLTSFISTPAYAEEPAQPSSAEQDQAQADDEVVAKAQGVAEGEEKNDEEEDDAGEGEGDDGEGEGDGDEEEEDEEEEEEEDEEPEDPMPKFQEECARTATCAQHKHEYEECAERVQRWTDAEPRERKRMGPKEDCVEEFFEFTHCVTQCAAPKLFKALK